MSFGLISSESDSDDIFGEKCCTGKRILVAPTTGMGLTNQLLTWAGGIKLGAYLGRTTCLLGKRIYTQTFIYIDCIVVKSLCIHCT